MTTSTRDHTDTDARPTDARPSALPAPQPGTDRLPFQKKINLLADRGHWPQMEALAKRHGWQSEELRAFIDANLEKAPCPICGTPFYVYSRRVKYCSDRCRRAAAAGNERGERPAAAAKAEKPRQQASGDLFVRLERSGGNPSERRFYVLMVVQDLFGSVALVRRWGRDEHERSQQVITNFQALDQALEQLDRYKEACLKRKYRIVGVERGRISRRDIERE